MPVNIILSVSALLALLPAALLPLRRDDGRDAVFWVLLAVAVAGPAVVVYGLFAAGWRTGLSSALWLNIVVSLLIFAVVARATRAGWRLAPLLLPYLILFGVLATIWQNQPERPLAEIGLSAWTELHIILALVTYGLLTIGAVAGFAVFLQERALKAKRPTALTRLLPSVSDGETLQVGLLAAGAGVLALGLVSGAGAQYFIDGELLHLGHKSVLSLVTFAVLIALLIAHYRTGIRGRRAARVVLLAYLLITLAYPGVKFVTDVVMS
jgi:ABC-type uncharacterized transport system permease subunit